MSTVRSLAWFPPLQLAEQGSKSLQGVTLQSVAHSCLLHSSSSASDLKEIFGFCALTTDQDEDYKAIWDITEMAVVPHRLAVHPDHSSRGIATALIKKAEELAKDRGYKSVRIDTNAMNRATNILFPKLGYQFLGHLSLASKPPDMKFNAYEKIL